LQTTITQARLKPYLKMVKGRVQKNPGNPAWTIVKARWAALVEGARETVAAYYRGRPAHRPTVIAAEAIVKIGPEVADDVWQTVAALYLMAEYEPRSFRDDDGFRFEMVRLVRNHGPVACGSQYVHQTGKVRLCYRDLNPTAVRVLGQALAEAFGVLGLHLAEVEQREERGKVEQKQAWRAALGAIA